MLFNEKPSSYSQSLTILHVNIWFQKTRLPLNWTEPHCAKKHRESKMILDSIIQEPFQGGLTVFEILFRGVNYGFSLIATTQVPGTLICFTNIIIPYLTLVLHNLLLSHVKIWIFKMIFCMSHQQGLQRQRRLQPLLLPRRSLSSLCPCGNTQISVGQKTWSQALCLHVHLNKLECRGKVHLFQ